MVNGQITKASDLLDENGALIQSGWSTRPLLRYNRECVAAGWHRLKEWDSYQIVHPEYTFGLIISDVGYFGTIRFEWIDFKKRHKLTGGWERLFTRGKMNLPTNSRRGDFAFENEKFSLSIQCLADRRKISVDFPSFGNVGLAGDITLHQNPADDSIVKANRYQQPHHFFYSDKLFSMPPEGAFRLGGISYPFTPEESYGRFDWGRGVWPYKIHWCWATCVGKLTDNREFWLSMGHSYDDPAFHDKNMAGLNGRGHKLGPITFHQPDDPMDNWRFTGNEGRVKVKLRPIFKHINRMNWLILSENATVLYGYFSGTVVLDDGGVIEIPDLLGHVEKTYWRW
jgi:hypothetical protein